MKSSMKVYLHVSSMYTNSLREVEGKLYLKLEEKMDFDFKILDQTINYNSF